MDQEQRDACSVYVELQLRLDMVKKLGSPLESTVEQNEEKAKEIIALCEKDAYFKSPDSFLVPDKIHTLGFMEHCRDCLELLQTVDAVRSLVDAFVIQSLPNTELN